MESCIAANLDAIHARITNACLRAGRDPKEVRLVAVSKTHPVDVIRAAIAAGVNILGENKVQEAEQKQEKIGQSGAEWHLIGHLQKNKARKAVQLFDVIHSLDSPELAHRLEHLCEELGRQSLPVFVQVDLAGEATKSGVAESDLPMLVEVLKRSKHLVFEGLMTLPPFFEDPEMARTYFIRLREIRDRLFHEGAFTHGAGGLSMGMTNDFEVAIEEGATIVRIGTAIFGKRLPNHGSI